MSVHQGDVGRDRHRPSRLVAAGMGIDGEWNAPHGRLGLEIERSRKRIGGETRVDLLDMLDRALARIAPGDAAILDQHPVEAYRIGGPAPGGGAAGTGGTRYRRARLAFGRELPVDPAVGERLELNVGAAQHDRVDHDLAGQQRPERDPHVEGIELDHVGRRGAVEVGEPYLGHRQLGCRQERHVDGPIDGELAAGSLADLGGDLAAVGVPVDKAGRDQGDNDGEGGNGEYADEEFLHETEPMNS